MDIKLLKQACGLIKCSMLFPNQENANVEQDAYTQPDIEYEDLIPDIRSKQHRQQDWFFKNINLDTLTEDVLREHYIKNLEQVNKLKALKYGDKDFVDYLMSVFPWESQKYLPARYRSALGKHSYYLNKFTSIDPNYVIPPNLSEAQYPKLYKRLVLKNIEKAKEALRKNYLDTEDYLNRNFRYIPSYQVYNPGDAGYATGYEDSVEENNPRIFVTGRGTLPAFRSIKGTNGLIYNQYYDEGKNEWLDVMDFKERYPYYQLPKENWNKRPSFGPDEDYYDLPNRFYGNIPRESQPVVEPIDYNVRPAADVSESNNSNLTQSDNLMNNQNNLNMESSVNTGASAPAPACDIPEGYRWDADTLQIVPVNQNK